MPELVSTIVPTYRRPEALERSLASVLRQTWRPLELIVVDDGSGDQTQQVLADWAAKAEAADVAYRYFERENGGPGAAKNFAMQQSTGSLLAFLDDDDRWYPQKLETQIAHMQMNPNAGVSFTRYVHESKEDHPKPPTASMRDGWVFESMCRGQTRVHQQTLMVRRDVQQRVGGFVESRNWEDTEFQLRLALETEFVGVNEPLTVIGTLETSLSRAAGLEGDLQRDMEKLRLLDQFAGQYAGHERFDETAIAALRARIYDEHIKHFIWLGRIDDAREARDRALSECGEQPQLTKLRGKLTRAKVAGWFGRKLRKP